MEYLLKNARVFMDGALHLADVFIRDGRIFPFPRGGGPRFRRSMIFILPQCFPGRDVHVHLREPGFL